MVLILCHIALKLLKHFNIANILAALLNYTHLVFFNDEVVCLYVLHVDMLHFTG